MTAATGTATLWVRPGQALYVGPSLDLDEHSGSVSCLVLGLDRPFTVQRPGAPDLIARSALVPPRVPHRVVADGGRMAFCYLDPGTRSDRGCQERFTRSDPPLVHSHRHEEGLVHGALRLALEDDVLAWIDVATGAAARPSDPRILAALDRLCAEPHGTGVEAPALAAGLSRSHFLRLFRAQTGTSLRRYRLWARMLRAAGTAGGGRRDLTSAAMTAGFASPSHFSTTFRAMFGLTPSRLLASGVRLEVG